MNSPFHAVARGLRQTNIGFLLACWGGAVALGLLWFITEVHRPYNYREEEFRWMFVGLFFAALATAVAGVVVGFVGRTRCLKVPEEYPAVRGRVVTAVVLEASGWASLLVGIGVSIAMSFRWLPDAQYVPGIGVLFSATLMISGRILFLRFLRKLAVVVTDQPSVRRARSSLSLFLADWLAALVGLGILTGGSALGIYELTNPLAHLLWIAACASGLYGLILYDRVLGGLARAVQAFADTAANEEEVDAVSSRRAYRVRDDGEDADGRD